MKVLKTFVPITRQKGLLYVLFVVLGLLIIATPVIIYIFIYHIKHNLISTNLYIFLFVSFVLTFCIGIYLIIRFLIEAREEIEKGKSELTLKDTIIQHSNEIVILLDMFSRIVSVNPAVASILNYSKEEMIGQPFRMLLYEQSFDDAIRLKDILLSRMKDVFKGYEADIILPCKVHHYSDVKSIAFKLIPIFKDNDLQYILALGKLVQSDFLTSKYLYKESAEFIIDNNITVVNLLSHRLTRNLEPYLDKREIVRIQLGLQEAIVNAIEHGNLAIDYETKSRLKKLEGNYWDHVLDICNKDYLKNRKIKIQYFLTPDYVKYIITDEGMGFDWKHYISVLPENNLIHNYHGVGLAMLQDIFQVSFNEKGNEITLMRYFAK